MSGTVPLVLGGVVDGLLLVPAGETWLLIDAGAAEAAGTVAVEPLTATDFSRPLARVGAHLGSGQRDRRSRRVG